jgi:hypothetical protein
MKSRFRLSFFVCWVIALLIHNLVHESAHYLAAIALGQPVLEFRFLTNGFGTSQVVYATPVAERAGYHWLAIAWLPSAVTVLLGYLIYSLRYRLLSPNKSLNLFIWYAGLAFLCLDPLYFGVLSVFVGGDIQAVQAVGWSPWPIRLLAVCVLWLNSRLCLDGALKHAR